MSKSMLTSDDLQAISDLLDKQTAVLATKQELNDAINSQTSELKAYIHEGIETVMDGMNSVESRLDIRVEKLEKDVKALKLNRQAV